MGKKSKRASGAQQASTASAIHSRAVCRLVDELWERTQGQKAGSVQSLLGDYDTVTHYVKQISRKQGTCPAPLPERGPALVAMVTWMQHHGAQFDTVEICEIPNVEYGLKAKNDIKKDDKVLAIPEALMMTVSSARQGALGALIERDRMLQVMPNVTLALHLLNERCDPNSFWRPYIDALPHSYTTPFYWSKDELKEFQSSPCLVKAITQIRNAARVYAHLHRLIRASPDLSLPLYEAGFHYEDFVWAISSVMSRQNEIPEKSDGSGTKLSLIPFWDLCNHTEGDITTFYNLEAKTCDCYALKDTPSGEEFGIFYGRRANYDLLIHQGFVFMGNQSDALLIALGLSSSDPLYEKRKAILNTLGIPLNGDFSVYSAEAPFSKNLVAFTRVFTASAQEMEKLCQLSQEEVGQVMFKDRWIGDQRVLRFLQTRCHLLLRNYASTLESDTALLESRELSLNTRLAIQMRICEKRILSNAIENCKTLQQQLAAIEASQQSLGAELEAQSEIPQASVSPQETAENQTIPIDQTVKSQKESDTDQAEREVECPAVGQAINPEEEAGSQTMHEMVLTEQVVSEPTLGLEELVISKPKSE